VKLFYFASVRQKIGRADENMSLPIGVATISDLISALCARGGGYAEAFAEPARLRAARNQDHVPLDARISDDDEIAFFPPVTGG
jgi:molybdopterin synthase sulfur carrier subunit